MKKIKTKAVNNKTNKNKSLDYLIFFVFILSIIVPIIIASTQYYIVQYGDDVVWISWAQNHHSNILDIFTTKMGTGYRPMMIMWYFTGYNLWGNEPFYYYLLNGVLFSGSMVFLYLLGKILHSRIAGLAAVLLYLFLDASFILVAKINFIATIGEIFFITSALYYSIRFFKNEDKLSMWFAIGLSVLAFLSKEPSILIIPVVNLTYLWYRGLWKKNYVIMNLFPFIYLFFMMFYITPDVGSGKDANLFQRILANFQFYFDTEITSQFKTPILLLISIIIAGYYYATHKLRAEIMLCLIWFIVAVLPFLITQQIVQPTYLAEANLGMVLLIGIVISEGLKKKKLILGLIIIGILFQASMIPGQISNMKYYNNMISNNQKTFLETVDSIKQLPSDETVFYFSNDVRQKYGMQIDENIFKNYLCLRNLCNIKVVTSYPDANYIVLPSSLDIYTFQKEMPDEKPSVLKQIKNGEDYGYLLKK